METSEPSSTIRNGTSIPGSHPGDRYIRHVTSNDLPLREIAPGRFVADLAQPASVLGKAWLGIRRVLIGRPLRTTEAPHERIGKAKALAVFSSDALSSVAYATEEILRILILAGSAAYAFVLPIGIAITILIGIVVFSYRQTIRAYPHGGGTYIVTRANLGTGPGLLAAAALLTDYLLTVAVSISAGVAAIVSAVPGLYPYRVELAVAAILFMTLANLRGMRESGTIFMVPTFAFLACMAILLGLGFASLVGIGPVPHPVRYEIPPSTSPLTVFLILRAFASGSTALTGIEAISNGLPAFKEPQAENARKTLLFMGLILASLFSGITLLSYRFHLVPSDRETIVSQLARTLVDGSPFYYAVQAATALILFLAANTAFADFPRLAYFLAHDRFLPGQFRFQGERLAYSTGILTLSALSILLVLLRGASVSALIPLYAVGVYTAFTLSQVSMVVHWWRVAEGRLRRVEWHSLILNGLGALATGIVTVVVVVTKFIHGAWIVILLIPTLILLMLGIRKHYAFVAQQLRVTPAEARRRLRLVPRRIVAVVPVSSLNRASLTALNYARAIADDVTAVHVATEPESGELIEQRWREAGLTIPLIIVDSPYRELIGPLVAVVEKLHREKGGPLITVIIPEFITAHWWERVLHTQTAWRLRRALLEIPDLVITSVPYHLEE
ncbi:MAG: APC family permease [Thermomicrobium sp.]|nr:APC family permease [Thermomicrobium sp.]MDW7982217.1 APC family permease [Thermomicrobium sp.]